MSTIRANSITDSAGSGAPDFPNGLTAEGQPLSSITLLGTITTTSGSSVTLSGLDLTPYKRLSIVCNGVSGSNASPSIITLNGYQFFRSNLSADAAAVAWGGGSIDLASGVFWSSSLITGTVNGLASGGESGLTTASTSITFAISAGTFDAGSIIVYGVK